MVLTGEGTAFSAGMDIKECFRDMKDQPRIVNLKVRRLNYEWKWRRLRYFEKPTIAMVSGWRFGGPFLPVVSCDRAIAAEEAQFGLSEMNWGILPAVLKGAKDASSECSSLIGICRRIMSFPSRSSYGSSPGKSAKKAVSSSR